MRVCEFECVSVSVVCLSVCEYVSMRGYLSGFERVRLFVRLCVSYSECVSRYKSECV